MTRVPSSSPLPAAWLLRTFQSKAAFRVFSTASAPPSMKKMWPEWLGGTATRANVSTNSAK